MSTKRFFTIIILLFIALLTSYASIPAIPITSKPVRSTLPSFVWEQYQPRDFQEIVNNSAIALTGSEPNYISIELSRSRVQAVYTGQSRPVSEARAALISAWFDANQADKMYKKLFATEWLFLENGKEYWLPVQATASEYMTTEFENGENVTLLVVLLGAHREDDKLDWLFVVNDVVPN
jgi:hypothetical protein